MSTKNMGGEGGMLKLFSKQLIYNEYMSWRRIFFNFPHTRALSTFIAIKDDV